MNSCSDVFWERFAYVGGTLAGVLAPLAAGVLFIIVVGALLRKAGYGTKRGGDPKSN